jgi:multidrug efflux system membrane fusion protein
MQPIAVTFTLPLQDLPRITDAMQKRQLPVDALAASGAKLAQGSLLTLDNAIDPSTGTIKLKAEFPNDDSRLWPGQFVTARLLADTERNALTVPSEAVQHGPEGLYVYVVGADSRAHRQPVGVDLDNGQLAVISKGIADGAVVVTAGQSRLDEGVRVAPRPAETAAGTEPGRA